MGKKLTKLEAIGFFLNQLDEIFPVDINKRTTVAAYGPLHLYDLLDAIYGDESNDDEGWEWLRSVLGQIDARAKVKIILSEIESNTL